MAHPKGKLRNEAFSLIRKDGILKVNSEKLEKGDDSFIQERAPATSTNEERPVKCSKCQGFFKKSYGPR